MRDVRVTRYVNKLLYHQRTDRLQALSLPVTSLFHRLAATMLEVELKQGENPGSPIHPDYF